MTPFAVRLANGADVPYIIDQANRNRAALGFIPVAGLEKLILDQLCAVVIENDDLAGYLLVTYTGGILRVHQACIQYDARRRYLGVALVNYALHLWKPDEVRLRCAGDLESNDFWQGMGFVCVGQVNGGKRRGRILNIWRLHLAPTLFAPVAVEVVRHEPNTGVEHDESALGSASERWKPRILTADEAAVSPPRIVMPGQTSFDL